MNKHLSYNEYIESLEQNKIEVIVDNSTAMLIMDRRNNLVQLMPKSVQIAHIFWMYVGFLGFIVSVLGLIISLFITIGSWYWYLGGIVLSLITIESTRKSASQFVIEESILNKDFYEAIVAKEIWTNSTLLNIIKKI